MGLEVGAGDIGLGVGGGLGAAEGPSVGSGVGSSVSGGTAWVAITEMSGYSVLPLPRGNANIGPVPSMVATISWATEMPTPDPSVKNASACSGMDGSLCVSSTTILRWMNTDDPSPKLRLRWLGLLCQPHSSLLRNPASSWTSCGPSSNAEILSNAVIVGTAPATAGLKLGAAEGTAVEALPQACVASTSTNVAPRIVPQVLRHAAMFETRVGGRPHKTPEGPNFGHGVVNVSATPEMFAAI